MASIEQEQEAIQRARTICADSGETDTHKKVLARQLVGKVDRFNEQHGGKGAFARMKLWVPIGDEIDRFLTAYPAPTTA